VGTPDELLKVAARQQVVLVDVIGPDSTMMDVYEEYSAFAGSGVQPNVASEQVAP
jgi:hypothetical protein